MPSKPGKTKKIGRTNIHAENLTSKPNLPASTKQVHRGDRRDTNPVFTNNNHRQPNLSNPAGSGKGQTQAGGKARRGGGKREKGTYDH